MMQEAGKLKNIVISGMKEEGKPTMDTVSTFLKKLNVKLYGEFTVQRLGGATNTAQKSGWFGRNVPTDPNQMDNTGGRNRPILVKLNNVADKKALYAARFSVKDLDNGKYQGVFINEDLTKMTSELFYRARMARKARYIKTAYTDDGILYAKKLNNEVITITKLEDLNRENLMNANFETDDNSNRRPSEIAELNTPV